MRIRNIGACRILSVSLVQLWSPLNYGSYLYEGEGIDLHVTGGLFLAQAVLDTGDNGGDVGSQRSGQHQDQLTW